MPLPRDNARHQQLLKVVAKGGGDVVFLGDSITERWQSTGAKVWREEFAPFKAVNLGVGGDQVGPGRKSVAFSVAYQSEERTLSEEDAARLRDAIVQRLGERYGAELRF